MWWCVVAQRRLHVYNVRWGFQENISLHDIGFTVSEQTCKPSIHLCLRRWIYVFWMRRSFVIVASFSCSSRSSLKMDGAGKLSRSIHFFSVISAGKKKYSEIQKQRVFHECQNMCFVIWKYRARRRATWRKSLSDQWSLTRDLCGTMKVPELWQVIKRTSKSKRSHTHTQKHKHQSFQ